MATNETKFSPEGKAAIATILRCMEDAQAAFSKLNNEENMACLDWHAEGASLNHCIRWGLNAAEEIQSSILIEKNSTDVEKLKSLELEIEAIKDHPSSTEGGVDAWNAGIKTLTKSAKDKIAKINEKIDAILNETEL